MDVSSATESTLTTQDPTQPIVTCRVRGRLGNQLFELAAIVAYALDHNHRYVFPSKELDPENYSLVNRSVTRQDFKNYDGFYQYVQKNWNYSKIPDVKGNIHLDGYFQSSKFFKNHEEEIKRLFAPTEADNAYLEKKYGNLLKLKPISIHIRRGDFLKLKNHHALKIDYYVKAMKRFSPKNHFCIFSDDIDFCKKLPLFKKYPHCTFIKPDDDVRDLHLMSACAHHIIANSTYSWWGAYLGKNPDRRVIAPDPKKWYPPEKQAIMNTSDVLEPHWEVIKGS